MTDLPRDLERTGAYRRADPDGKRLVWLAVSALAVILLTYLGWIGITVSSFGERLAAVEAKMDILLHERLHADRGQT